MRPLDGLRTPQHACAAFPLTPVLPEAFRARHPQASLSTRHYGFGDPAGGLLNGQTDVAIVRPPFRSDGLELLVIASEPRYVALSDVAVAWRAGERSLPVSEFITIARELSAPAR